MHLILVTFLFSGLSAFAAETRQIRIEKLEFTAPVNLKSLNVHGKATEEVKGQATYEGNKLIGVDVTIPVEKLSTNMSLRDRHMKERVFSIKDGATPPVVFKADKLSCDLSQDG